MLVISSWILRSTGTSAVILEREGDKMNKVRFLWVVSLLVLLSLVVYSLPLQAGGAPRTPTPTAEAPEQPTAQPTAATPQPTAPVTQAAVFINEFMADANRGLEDPDEPGEYPDWVELYNAGDTDFSLDGLYLTDSQAEPTLYAIPTGLSIPAGGFIVFFADNEPDQGPLHVNFALGRGGEFIGLYDPATESFIDGKSFAQQTTNVSEGRVPDGGIWSVLSQPSPGASNQ
jgi:hypothetical protein